MSARTAVSSAATVTRGRATDDPSTPPAPGGLRSRVAAAWRRAPWLFSVANVGTFLLLWQWLASAGVLSDLFFPAPTAVFAELWEGFSTGLLWVHIGSSFQNFTIGLGLSCLIAIPLGLVMGANRYVDALVSPYVWALASMPSVALVPLLVLMLGFTDAAKISLIVLSAVFPIMINCMAGVKTVDKSLLTAGQVFGAKKRQLYSRVVLPSAAPFVISGVNQGMSQALIGLVVAEMFATRYGLGYLMVRAQESFNAPLLYGVLILLVVISLTFVEIMRRLEARVAPWQTLDGI